MANRPRPNRPCHRCGRRQHGRPCAADPKRPRNRAGRGAVWRVRTLGGVAMAYGAAAMTNSANVGDGERTLSATLGAALLINGVVRPSLWHTLLAFAGAAMLQRGLTGHCALYRSLGIDTAGNM